MKQKLDEMGINWKMAVITLILSPFLIVIGALLFPSIWSLLCLLAIAILIVMTKWKYWIKIIKKI